MTHDIALIHKDPDSCYGVSFPDLPGPFTAADTVEEAMQQAAEVLRFAAEDWTNPDVDWFQTAQHHRHATPRSRIR